jgi:hypothetical protein
VVLLVGIMGWLVYSRFLDVHRHLWYNTHHDRNAHYLLGLKLADAIKHGKIYSLLRDLNAARIWPPLHGAVLAPILVVGGFDYRLAVLPSLAGWMGAAVFGFLVARRAVAGHGNVAGLVAALFILGSPAHRAFATDIMLESLGACLTLAVLYFYLVCVQEERAWAGPALGLTLTLLFFHKYNYWLLVVFALVGAECFARAGLYARYGWGLVRTMEWRKGLAQQVRSPINHLLAGVLAVMALILLTGTKSITLFGRPVGVYPLHNIVTVAYGLLFLRLLSWWRVTGRTWKTNLDPRYGALLSWHVWPVAISFLLPKRLGCFLWYLSPANFSGEVRPTFAQSVSFYGNIALSEYHLGLVSAVIALALVVLGLGAAIGRRLRPGGSAVVLLFLIGAWLTVSHPCHQARYLHSWFAAGWAVAGIGLAGLLSIGLLSNRVLLRSSLAVALVVSLALLQAQALEQPGHAREGGPDPKCASILDVTDGYLDSLEDTERASILSTVPFRFLSEWTWTERHGEHDHLECHWFGFGKPGAENREGFQSWLRTTPCTALVFIDGLTPGDNGPDSREPECVLHRELRGLLLTQTSFYPDERYDFPRHGVSVTIWRRTSAATASR